MKKTLTSTGISSLNENSVIRNQQIQPTNSKDKTNRVTNNRQSESQTINHSTLTSAMARKVRFRGFTRLQVIVLILCALSLQRLFLLKPKLELYLPESADRIAARSFSRNPLVIPEGQARNLPSLRIADENLESYREEYGGQGDAKHLGGFTEIDMDGISPATWKHVVTNWTVQSVLDVGCGRGISTSWFATHGLRTECVEGSHDAIQKSMVPDKDILTEHDFSRGPWWPDTTFDMVWSVEFLEHVNLHFQYNYVSAFRKAAIIMVTSSFWGGWHHVEVHENEWWIRKFESYGFKYDERLTGEIRDVAAKEAFDEIVLQPNGKALNAQHVWTSMKVFINPVRTKVYSNGIFHL